MECKNCNQSLSSEDNFCNVCGAKVINHRLTLKHLFSEFYHAILSIDANKPVQTFIDLFKKPEEVIGSYINGTRKKYIHAFGYFTIAVTFSSVFYFILLTANPNAFDGAFALQNNTEAENNLVLTIQRAVFDYQTLIFFAAIPIMALMSWIVFFNKRKYNYAEHLIINLYAYSQASIVAIMLYLLTIWNDKLFSIINIVIIFLQIIYFAFVLKRLYKLSVWQVILKTLFFLLLFIPIYIIVSILIVTIIMASGGFDALIEAEKAKQEVSQLIYFTINCIV